MSSPPGTCENYNSVRHPFIMNCFPSFYNSTVYLTETYPGMDHTEVLQNVFFPIILFVVLFAPHVKKTHIHASTLLLKQGVYKFTLIPVDIAAFNKI